jgi:hypothetical protein
MGDLGPRREAFAFPKKGVERLVKEEGPTRQDARNDVCKLVKKIWNHAPVGTQNAPFSEIE